MILNQLRHLRLVMALLILWACSSVAKAQTNAQILYDFGSDRKFVTLTLEMFKQDKWGSTYFFVDHDFNYDKMVVGEKNIAQGGTYTEISRALNFWQKTQFKNWSLHVEYNGGITKNYPINNAWLFGVEYLVHDKNYKNTLTLDALYKTIRQTDQNVPLQFTAVWTCNDIFGVKGLKFDGFADFWWETHAVDYQEDGSATTQPHSLHHRATALVQCRSALRLREPQCRRRGRVEQQLWLNRWLQMPSLLRCEMGLLVKSKNNNLLS